MLIPLSNSGPVSSSHGRISRSGPRSGPSRRLRRVWWSRCAGSCSDRGKRVEAEATEMETEETSRVGMHAEENGYGTLCR